MNGHNEIFAESYTQNEKMSEDLLELEGGKTAEKLTF
jgi:hypothetical protein